MRSKVRVKDIERKVNQSPIITVKVLHKNLQTIKVDEMTANLNKESHRLDRETKRDNQKP